MKLNSKWHFDDICWEYHPKWWKPYIHSFKVENDTIKGKRRYNTDIEIKSASDAWLSYYGHDGFWIFHWLGFEISFSRH